MSVTLFKNKLKAARRDALVSHYLATHNFSSLPAGSTITTADDLYEYLLLDTKISNAVTTTRLSEAVSSLQLCIHRALEGYDGELADDATSMLAQEAFLDNWDRYNSRYSTWAGKEKLRFYAGNYVEPSLRTGETQLFRNLENALEQGRFTEQHVNDSLLQYLVSYQELADLIYLSATFDRDSSVLYFLAYNAQKPASYYWRTLSLTLDNRSYASGKWGEWHLLNAGISEVRDETSIALSVERGRLNVQWLTDETQQDENKTKSVTVKYSAELTEEGGWKRKGKSDDTSLPPATGKITKDSLQWDSPHGTLVIELYNLYNDCTPDIIGKVFTACYVDQSEKIYFLSRGNDGLYIYVLKLKKKNSTGDIIVPDYWEPTEWKIKKDKLLPLEYLDEKKSGLYFDSEKRLHLQCVTCLPITITDDQTKESAKGTIDCGVDYQLSSDEDLTLVDSFLSVDGVCLDDTSGVPTFIGAIKHNKTILYTDKNEVEVEYTFDYEKQVVNVKINRFPPANGGRFYFGVYLLGGKDNVLAFESFGETELNQVVSIPFNKSLMPGEFNGGSDPNFSILSPFVEISHGIDFPTVLFTLLDNPQNFINFNKISSYGSISGNTFIPPSGSALEPISLGKSSFGKINLPTLLKYNGLSALFDFNVQKISGGTDAFSGAYGQYLWEIFFHIPFLVASRFATEQRFEEAERWYKYIFNSAGYRDKDGKLQPDDNGNPRYWNSYPLQEDCVWDSYANEPASTDPDVIATADPMHYKLAVFRHTLDLLIARGDAAYRMLERDTLTEAKMFYAQVQQLLGPRPDIRINNSWPDPTLSDEAGEILFPVTAVAEAAPLTFAWWLRTGDHNSPGDGDFLPPYNDVLLAYHDKLEVRLYNLRHNLSLDGQPLSLPSFAIPVDPTELYRQQSGGDNVQGEDAPADKTDTGWRYPPLADHARYAAGLLSQFGSSLLSALERRDGEKLTLLLQTQQMAVLGLQQDIAAKNLDALNASLDALNSRRASAELRKVHYENLINEGLSAAEIAGLTLRSSAMATNIGSVISLVAGGALSAVPNIFGLADGGGDFGAPLTAVGFALQTAASAQEQSAGISEVTAGYQRRAGEWMLESNIADREISETDAQINALKTQIVMQQKQITLAEMESANAQAVYDLHSTRFTGQALYDWMTGRLSALYYQMYDATVPVCLQACNALRRELGKDRAQGLFCRGMWNDLYQGLLAGEALLTDLLKLESIWLMNSAQGLEATRTVSMAALRGEASGCLSDVISAMLAGTPDSYTGNGQLILDADTGIFSVALDMSQLGLQGDYGTTSSRKKFFIKSIAVTLPTLLGPYQDIAATLSCNGETATLSHGMQDTGRFVVNLQDSRFQPFEGIDPTYAGNACLTLSVFNVKGKADGVPNQRHIVENLSDIIFHIRYIMR